MAAVLELEVRPLGTLGAEVRGVDLARVTGAQVQAIKRAWYRHDVLLFRNQRLSDDHLLSFSRHFGALDSPPNQGAGRKSPTGYPEVYIVSNVREDKGEPIGA
ncbi:MAG TPA: TauD/TfdA family dioxygenase, partial [Burkholderiales bacterium]|nr:TauD/TfdA family dioxygenase [Burkholderiales bacterium]